MTGNTHRISDLRARALAYQEKADLMKEGELHDQFQDLATRYMKLADEVEVVATRPRPARRDGVKNNSDH